MHSPWTSASRVTWTETARGTTAIPTTTTTAPPTWRRRWPAATRGTRSRDPARLLPIRSPRRRERPALRPAEAAPAPAADIAPLQAPVTRDGHGCRREPRREEAHHRGPIEKR